MNKAKLSIAVHTLALGVVVALVLAGSAAALTDDRFRVGPSVTLRPVTDVIETNQDGIVELFASNPSLNEVLLNVDVRISVPSGIHVYGQSFGEGAGAGVVAGTFSVPPGTSRTIILVIKADKSARIGSHSLMFTGLYWPGDNKNDFQPISLKYVINVKEPSNNPDSAAPSTPTFSTPTPSTPTDTIPAPTATPASTPTPSPTPSASVQLHGEKTDVLVGEDIVFKLSAVNKITKPMMTVQVILIPPSGMSVTSSEFATSGAGQYTTTYKLEPGDGKNIEVRIKTNQQGDFNVKGEIIYYYGDDNSTAEDQTLNLPIKVREIPKTPAPISQSPTLSFWVSILVFGISYRLKKGI